MTLKTKNGKDLHPIGIGTWGIGGFGTADNSRDREAIDSIQYSISLGQNHIDTAEMYAEGHSEELVGNAINSTKRKDIFIATKLWKTNVNVGQVKPAVGKMLDRLQTDYIDMLYIHAPWVDAPWRDAISQIDELIDEGIVRFFAVSNFELKDIKDAQNISRHKIAANQIHLNVGYKDFLTHELESYCNESKTKIVAYRPIERGELYQNKLLVDIANDHGATEPQIALAWLIANNYLPIPKAVSKKHIDENIDSLKIKLTEENLKILNTP